MYITEFEIENLRCFAGKHKVSLDRGGGTYAGWTVFAGRNGSGKSTLLKALAAAAVGPSAAQILESGTPNWRREKTASANVRVHLLPAPGDTGERVVQGSKKHAGLRFDKQGRLSASLVFRRSSPVDFLWGLVGGAFIRRDWSEHPMSPWGEASMGWFVAGYGPFRRLGPSTVEVTKMSANPKLARMVNLFREEATLSDAVDWLKEVHARALETRRGAATLRDDVLALLNDGLLPDGSEVRRVNSDGLWIHRDGHTFPLKQVSDGYRTVAALVVDLARHLHQAHGNLLISRGPRGLQCEHHGVVLIDEIDAHLHVEWQQRIGTWLTQHFPKIQFLVTSHSPFICQAASPRGILRLPGPGEKRKIEHLESRLFQAVVNGGADDAVMSELFGLDHAHSARAEALRQRVAQLELKMLQGTATKKEQQQYQDDRALLPDGLGELADRKLRMLQSQRAPAKKKAPVRKPAVAGKKAAARKRVPASEKARAGRARTR